MAWHDGFEVNYHLRALTPPPTLSAPPMVPAAKPQYAQVIEHHALPHARRNIRISTLTYINGLDRSPASSLTGWWRGSTPRVYSPAQLLFGRVVRCAATPTART